MHQQTLMQFDPASGEPRPYPSHAEQWRAFHGFSTAWLFDPWTGTRRAAGDVGQDVLGRGIKVPGEPVLAAAPPAPAVPVPEAPAPTRTKVFKRKR